MTLIYLSSAWLAGLYAGSRFAPPKSAVLLAMTALALILLLWRTKGVPLLGGMCFVLFLFGTLRFQQVGEGDLKSYNGASVQIIGMVSAEPKLGDTALDLRLSTREITAGSDKRSISGLVLVHTHRYPGYRYGDVLEVSGQLQEPPEFDEFNYREYLARQGIHSTMLYPQIKPLQSGHGFKPQEWLYALRERLSQALASALPEPQASLAQGILLGQRTTIPESLNEAFAKTGTSHIVAISGHNISVVAGMLMAFLAVVLGRNRSIYFLAALGAIWAYALLAGMAPSVERAATMASLALLAAHLGRQNSAATSLVFAAAVLAGLRPTILGDVAFQLSFAAMAGLIFITPHLEAPTRRALERSRIRTVAAPPVANIIVEGSLATLGATMATLPIIAFNFHRIPLVALPTTLLALPTLPPLIMTSALVGVAGLLLPPLAQVASCPAWLFATCMIKIVTFFSNTPLASVSITGINHSLVWGYYALLVGAIWFSNNGKHFRSKGVDFVKRHIVAMTPARWLIAPLALVALLVWLAVFALPDNRLHVSFLDVGQGDAILIQTPSHLTILVDGGPNPQDATSELGKRLPFWDREIDLVILTHPQADHLSGLIQVLSRYRVKQVLESGFPCDTADCREWAKLIEEKEIKHDVAAAGQKIYLGDNTELEVLQPEEPFVSGTSVDMNNNSVVLRLVMGNASFLLTGDIQQEAESRLVSQMANIRSSVLKVAHHGSATATSRRFLNSVDPQLAIISVGTENRFGHPDQETLNRLADTSIYRTDLQGTIEITTDGRRLWVKTERR